MSAFDPRRLLEVLVAHEVEFVVIGLTAAFLQGSPAVTVDLDVLPRQDLDNADRLAAALNELHARPVSAPGHRELEGADFVGWQPQRFLTDAGPLDVVPEAVGIGTHDQVPAVVVRIGETAVRVATLEAIIASKELLDRPKDRAALPALYAALRARTEGSRPSRPPHP